VLAPPAAHGALLLLDLDQFKELNDTLGHQAGDALLRQLGPRLVACAGEHGTVGRLGGDEFGVLAPGVSGGEAVELAVRIREALAAPFAVEGIAIQVEGSVGIALHPQDGADVSTLLRHADVAMYDAKRLRGGHALYAPSEDRPTRDELGLTADLRAAIAEGQLTLRYQPIVDMRTCRIRSAEALVRWDHPERGELPPAVFLRAVERAGLVRELTRSVLDQAIARLAAWQAPGGTGWGLGVNVTATDLLDQGFVDEVAELLRRHGAPAHRLKLEITEGILLTDPTRAAAVLGRLRELGVRTALDDFGTGYSSLTHLQRMPVDALKVDRSFVGPMTADPAAAVIVRSVVGLAHALDLSVVVAEGVEDAATWRALAALGCDAAQGYLLSRPLRGADLEAAAPEIESRAREADVLFALGPATAARPALAGAAPRTSPTA
jgi:diguanylate cyclase (GGDEF)-like protein